MSNKMRKLRTTLETHPLVRPVPLAFNVYDGDVTLGYITLHEFERMKSLLTQCAEPPAHVLGEDPFGEPLPATPKSE